MMRALVLAGAAILVSRAALGATVEVAVYERGGGPIVHQPVTLYAVTPESPLDPGSPFGSRAVGRCTTDGLGLCAIENLPAGVYTADVRPVLDPNFCNATGSPVEAYGTVTLSAGDAKARLRIELERGIPVHLSVDSPDHGIPSATRVELTSENGEQAVVRITAGKGLITLEPGRWIAHLVGPPGALVVKVELDDIALDTLDVPIALSWPSSGRFVTWTLSEPCSVRGTVKSTRRETGVSVGAVLVRPGPWGASAFCRVTDCAGSPHSAVGRNGLYGFELPCGAWRIAPFGDSLIESTPAVVPVDLQEGQTATVDFDVRETEPDGRSAELVVYVQSPEGNPVEVPVELWPPEGNTVRQEPLETKATGRFRAPARFSGLAAGSYLLRVRVPGCRVVVERVSDLDPEAREPRSVTIRPGRGATIDALVRDENDRPIAGVALDVTRIDVPPPSDDPAVRLAEEDVEISVPPSKDQTGHVIVSGLSAGSYRVKPVLSGALVSAATAVVGPKGERGDDETTVDLDDDGRAALEVRVLPAASIGGRLVCADGRPLPLEADVCVLGQPSSDEDEAARAACLDPILPMRMNALSGEERNEFHAGPLAPGSYRIGLRPRGYGGWTWALGTPNGSGAALLQVEEAAPVDLGTVTVLCGPAIEIRPSVRSGDPLPDLTTARVEGTLSRREKDETIDTRPLSVTLDPDRVVLRELPEGEWTLNVTISHAFFVPPGPIHLVVPVKLVRGALLTQPAKVAAVGGSVVVAAGRGAARLVSVSGEARIESVKDGWITFDGVAPDIYRVDMCNDPLCARITRQWPQVRVILGRRTELTEHASSSPN